jgi:predicted amidohydrolase YtcJ
MIRQFTFLVFSLEFLLSCGTSKMKADLIVHHAKVYTADGSFAVLESFAIRDGKFIAIGTNESIMALYDADSTIDAGGKVILPGIIDAHCHFVGYGLGLQECDLVGTKSFDEVIDRVKTYAATNKYPWIVGRGWDQNDWAVKQFPDNKMLDSLFPNTPVILKRIDGHAALVNATALQIAGINDSTKISGGEIIRTIEEVRRGRSGSEKITYGKPTGILVDNAVDLVTKKIPQPHSSRMEDALLTAQQNCFEFGLTTVTDAGLMKWEVDAIDQLQKSGKLQMRVYAMLSDSAPNYDYYLKNGPYKTDYLNVRSFKFYADGALGSRGACLLSDYSDAPGQKGFLLNSPAHYEAKMKLLAEYRFQVCTHCIGDSANRFILNLYGKIMSDSLQRWRIEHAQIVSPQDMKLFGEYGVIPSVQPVHATSDMYWAEKRLGAARIGTAYAYREQLESIHLLALGTDFPVENINPMYTFYAAVARMDLKQYPAGGYQMENAIDRRSALLGMTRWAAYANFEEEEKGSIEAGKFADFIMLDNDPMTCKSEEIPTIKVLNTFIAGKNVYTRK